MAGSIFRSGLFEGKVGIVTGGGTGIGRAIATELLDLGCNVVIASRKMDVVEAAAKEMSNRVSNGREKILATSCNIRDEEQAIALVKSTIQRFGRVDFLVNNGGGQFLSPAANMTFKGWKAVIDTNLNGTFNMCRAVYEEWFRDHGGSIVNIIADMWNGFPGMAHTGAARAGVDNLTKTLATEWAISGVRVNSVAPGVIYSSTAAANYQDPSLLKKFLPYIPAKRLGTPDEVSAAVCFLLSPAASFVSGASLRIDGGASIYNGSWPISLENQHKSMPPFLRDEAIEPENFLPSSEEELTSNGIIRSKL